MNTAEQVLAALSLYDLKPAGKNQWKSNSPLRPGSNSHAFALTIDDGEHGAYHDHVSGDHGSLYELAKALNIPLPEKPAADTPKGYSGLAEYAAAHGVDATIFTAAGWMESEHKGRPCLKFMTTSGFKVRYIDGKDPKFQPTELGYQFCWYGLKYGIPMAQSKGVLVIANGEPSVIVAQHYGIPAVCHTGGENKNIPEQLIEQLKPLYQGDIIVALDCDKAGREGALKWQKALIYGGYNPRVVDLRLMDKGDVADFCMLYEENSLDALRKCDDLNPALPLQSEPEEKLIITRSETMAEFNRQLLDSFVPEMPPMINPLKVLHKFGGECHIIDVGQLMGIIGSSGTGKTSMLETIMDALLRLNQNIIAWSPEWKPYQLAQRAVQRYAGPTMEALRLHKLWQWERANGVTNHQGRPLSQQVISAAFDKAEDLAAFPGDVAYVPNNILTIDNFIAQYPKMLDQFGKPIHALVIDYVQLMHSLEKTDVSMYDTLMKIRHMCMTYNLVGFIASQTTKAATAGQKEMKLLDGTMARFVNEDAFNVIVTINPEFNAMGEWLHSGVLKVDKNSSGKKGMVRVKMNLSLLSWIDEATDDQNFSQYEK